jgi:4-hydroxybenzoate polyprenyltransferase
MFLSLLSSLRPKQWIKNGFVFAALVFDGQLTNIPALLRTGVGFVLFCLASSSIYLINDIRDLEEDRRHPTKRNRPLPSGRLPISRAWAAAALLAVVSIGGGFLRCRLAQSLRSAVTRTTLFPRPRSILSTLASDRAAIS